MKKFHIWLAFISVFLLIACETKTEDKISARTIILQHTSGTISRESPIKIVFYQKMIPEFEVGKALEASPFQIDPGVVGKAEWLDRRTLIFRPEKRLPGGESYNVTLALDQIVAEYYNYRDFEFRFSTIRQTFTIVVDQLQALRPDDLKAQKLTGELVTADSEDGIEIEKMVKAVQEERDLTVEWRHAADRRTHQFVITGITRNTEESQVTIMWDGSEIDVDDKGEQQIKVPALNAFEITDVSPVQDKTEYIAITFSDPLKKNQNLAGLIRTRPEDNLRFESTLNTIRVYNTNKWQGTIDLTVDAAIRNVMGFKLGTTKEFKVTFENIKPQVRFIDKGVILPTSNNARLAIEAVNLHAIIVEATQIYEHNIPQFLQRNNLSGDYELNRVGQVVWQDTVQLNLTPDKRNQWIRYGLDLKPLVKNYPKGMYRLRIYFTRNQIEYECAESVESEDDRRRWSRFYQNRENPCHPAYYQNWYDHKIAITRNILISDIGLLAKKDPQNGTLVICTDLKTGKTARGLEVALYNFQQKEIGKGTSDANGMVFFEAPETPALVIARDGNQTGYLKLGAGESLQLSHFDVSGKQSPGRIKGFIYGERDVWRPGNTIYLTFLLYDPLNKIPDTHPARLDLYNARDQLVNTVINTKSLNGFYHFKLTTNPDDPTGNWRVAIRVGGSVFEQTLKIESIMPNRLDIDLDFGERAYLQNGRIQGTISAEWLHGAPAKNLRADLEMALKNTATHFNEYANYQFDDPARNYYPESFNIFDGKLNAAGKQNFSTNAYARNKAPGLLQATIKARVFESSGAFSTELFSLPFHPYQQYAGVYIPALKANHGRLLSDSSHTVQLALVNRDGTPVQSGEVEIRVYKIEWRWWWQRDRRGLADYVENARYDPIITDKVKITNGTGLWRLQIPGPSWGRYLVRVKDKMGDHQTGAVVYAYSPGWYGRDRMEAAEGISTLNVTTDKKEYTVGEEIALTIPTSSSGRGVVTVESGTKILQTHPITGNGESLRFTLPAIQEMTPNVYLAVHFWQPHQGVNNDLPIRMYGVVPISVYDPNTRLTPRLEIPDVLEPESEASISVREQDGREMTYTVAIVDQGLLNLTGFKTPNPWDYFFQREALGITTWDIFDFVSGAYGSGWESLLAIGGGEAVQVQAQKKADRFPPMVIFLGPFALDKNKTNTHQIKIPQYVGAVRAMVVAANQTAFGAIHKNVQVKKPLMILGTLPRVLSPTESVDLPVAVFAMDEKITNVTTRIETNDLLTVEGSAEKKTEFSEVGDKLVTFKLKIGQRTGMAKVSIASSGNGETAKHDIELNVRQPNQAVTDVYAKTLTSGQIWEQQIKSPGIPGTNKAWLEVSRIPPLNLGRRLEFLIRYPHGCVEQTTSAAFPQIYLPDLMRLTESRANQAKNNVIHAINRLRSFQLSNGGFTYWPGSAFADDWSSNYAGHFLLEAKRAGYNVPELMLARWIRYQKNLALSWVTGPKRSALIQTYRLYTLALAGEAQLSAMNRLREDDRLNNTAKWRLAAAYHIAGYPDVANALAAKADLDTDEYQELYYTYGSGLRDKAMILEALAILGRTEQAVEVVEEVSEKLCSEKWLSTQTTAYALLAMARYAGISEGNIQMQISYAWNDESDESATTDQPLYQMALTALDNTNNLELNNEGTSIIYPRVVMEGVPEIGSETAGENGLSLKVRYLNMSGKETGMLTYEQGSDYIVELAVTNTGNQGVYHELALSHLLPSGFEIQNARMTADNRIENDRFDYQDIRDDRIYTYFDLKPKETKRFQVVVNASYAGRYYLPMIWVEAMYDATIYARQAGRWIEIVKP